MDIRDVYTIMKNLDGKEGFKAKADAVVSRPIPKELIKSREGAGKMMLSYIEGETVIRLLNEAFGEEGWSFQIVDKYIVPTEPKQMTEWDSATKKSRKLFNADGTPKLEPQSPIAEVHGRLIVPGFGVREQFGTKILNGGASDQEGASKAAATDALKKCATLFGIGLELYDDKPNQQSGGQPAYNKGSYGNKAPDKPYSPPTIPAPPKDENPWVGKEGEIKKLKELKAILGVNDNDKLNPFVAEFTGSKTDSYEKITPANITAFNKFLEKKASNV